MNLLTTFPVFVWIGAQPFFFDLFQTKIHDVKSVRAYIFASELGRLVIKNLPTFFMILSYIMLNSKGSDLQRHRRARPQGQILFSEFDEMLDETNLTTNISDSPPLPDPESFVE